MQANPTSRTTQAHLNIVAKSNGNVHNTVVDVAGNPTRTKRRTRLSDPAEITGRGNQVDPEYQGRELREREFPSHPGEQAARRGEWAEKG